MVTYGNYIRFAWIDWFNLIINCRELYGVNMELSSRSKGLCTINQSIYVYISVYTYNIYIWVQNLWFGSILNNIQYTYLFNKRVCVLNIMVSSVLFSIEMGSWSPMTFIVRGLTSPTETRENGSTLTGEDGWNRMPCWVCWKRWPRFAVAMGVIYENAQPWATVEA